MVEPQQIAISLDGTRVGTLEIRGGSSRFRFSEDYLYDPNRKVLGLQFEENLRRSTSGQFRLPPWFANLLPEGRLREMFDGLLDLRELNAMQSQSTLLLALGLDLPGAVEARHAPPGTGDEDPGEDWNETPEQMRREYQKAEGALRFSIAGIGLKFSMIRSEQQYVLPASNDSGEWIVKLPDFTFPHLPRNEFAMMTLASLIGIDVPEIRLVHRDEAAVLSDELWGNEEVAYAIRRFDRSSVGKVHIEDLAQVRGFYPDDKYKGTFETVGNFFYRGRDARALEEFARRLAFSVVIGNWDAHLKNWSLIYPDGRVPTISPAYDLVSVAAYPGAGLVDDLGLRFGGSRARENVTLASFEQMSQKILGDRSLGDIAREVIRATSEHLPQALELLSDVPNISGRIAEQISASSKQLLS